MWRESVRWTVVALAAALLAGCASRPPSNSENLCEIFKERPRWYRAAKKAEERWMIPAPVMMAVMYKESSYVADARPPRSRLLGIIPWKRSSSAYGFAQATDAAWSDYLRDTGHRSADRDDFADAVDFVGWYLNRSHRHLGIAREDAHSLYLSYYAGLGGYRRGTWRNNAWLKDAATRVDKRSDRYQRQLERCPRLDRRWWWFAGLSRPTDAPPAASEARFYVVRCTIRDATRASSTHRPVVS